MDTTSHPAVLLVAAILTLVTVILAHFYVGGLVLLVVGAVARLALGTLPPLLVFNGANFFLFGLASMLFCMVFCRKQ